MLDCNDSAYLAARAIQFFTPGIPQIYYVGLLAGRNDTDAVARTGEGREINRHNYSVNEIDQEVQRPVVKKLIELIEFRNTHPAFNGNFVLGESNDHEITLTWNNQDSFAKLYVDFLNMSAKISCLDPNSKEVQKMDL
jgi:sucrose phosphorylase